MFSYHHLYRNRIIAQNTAIFKQKDLKFLLTNVMENVEYLSFKNWSDYVQLCASLCET